MRRVAIIGAAGRDFHVFNTVYRWSKEYKVVAFLMTQIPIPNRRYPLLCQARLREYLFTLGRATKSSPVS